VIASRPDIRRAAAVLASLVCLVSISACGTPAGLPPEDSFDEALYEPILVPDVVDYAAADLAAAALLSDTESTERVLRRMHSIDIILEASEDLPTGLLPVSTDLRNATLDDPREYREATRELLRDPDLGIYGVMDNATEERLEQAAADDPLLLASARMNDIEKREIARLFNTIAEPIGSSLMTSTLLPYRMGRAVLNYAVSIYNREPISTQGRQALFHWENYLALHPDDPELAEISALIEKQRGRWNHTQYLRSMRSARRAQGRGEPRHTIVYANRALGFMPEDEAAAELRNEAVERLIELRELEAQSLAPPLGDSSSVIPANARAFSLDLFVPKGEISRAAIAPVSGPRDEPLSDEARFTRAIADFESGDEARRERAWQSLEALAQLGDDESNMARHASALLRPKSHPYRAFEAARSRDRWGRFRWISLGMYANGPLNRQLPMPLQTLIDSPAILQAAIGMPFRLLKWPWQQPLPSARTTAIHAHRYLELNPEGAHSKEVRQWIVSFEKARGNWVAAHQSAEEQPEIDPKTLAKLQERAADQSLAAAERENNRYLRNAMYRRIASEYPLTRSGRAAGNAARFEAEHMTPTRIQITRGFLTENPEVAGPRGLGLKSQLLDDEAINGELHPDGVALLGGREIELSFLAESGDEDEKPRRTTALLSPERFARLVSLLEETSFENSLLDSDDQIIPDAQRDVFFERARIGLADETDRRSDAESTFAYRGIRERYGMVRSRPSILPFDLVLRGSLEDFSLGAFPRLRPPQSTPDAFLYE